MPAGSQFPDLGQFFGEVGSPGQMMPTTEAAKACPLLDGSASFCTLDEALCPFVGFNYRTCKKYITQMAKGRGVIGLNSLTARNNAPSPIKNTGSKLGERYLGLSRVITEDILHLEEKKKDNTDHYAGGIDYDDFDSTESWEDYIRRVDSEPVPPEAPPDKPPSSERNVFQEIMRGEKTSKGGERPKTTRRKQKNVFPEIPETPREGGDRAKKEDTGVREFKQDTKQVGADISGIIASARLLRRKASNKTLDKATAEREIEKLNKRLENSVNDVFSVAKRYFQVKGATRAFTLSVVEMADPTLAGRISKAQYEINQLGSNPHIHASDSAVNFALGVKGVSPEEADGEVPPTPPSPVDSEEEDSKTSFIDRHIPLIPPDEDEGAEIHGSGDFVAAAKKRKKKKSKKAKPREEPKEVGADKGSSKSRKKHPYARSDKNQSLDYDQFKTFFATNWKELTPKEREEFFNADAPYKSITDVMRTARSDSVRNDTYTLAKMREKLNARFINVRKYNSEQDQQMRDFERDLQKAIRMGTATPADVKEIMRRVKSPEARGTLARGMNKFRESLIQYDLRTTKLGNKDVLRALQVSLIPKLDKNHYEIMRMSEQAGLRAIQLQHQYGNKFGKFNTWNLFFKRVALPGILHFLGFRGEVIPNLMTYWPDDVIKSFYFSYLEKPLPKYKGSTSHVASKDTKFWSSAKMANPTTHNKIMRGYDKDALIPPDRAVLHTRSVPTTRKSWLKSRSAILAKRHEDGKVTRTSDQTDWRSGFSRRAVSQRKAKRRG